MSVPAAAPSRNGSSKRHPPRLHPAHLADLRASGLSDEQIEACGFYSTTDQQDLRHLLHMDARKAAKLGPCLVIPYHDVGGVPMTCLGDRGEPHPYIRVKPSHPRTDKARGKPIKYEQPAGIPPRLYIPPGSRAVLADPAAELVITEGEKKAAACDQHGVPAVGVAGAWMWQVHRPKGRDGKASGPRELIPDLAGVPWAGRRVVVCFDSDAADNQNVRWAEWHLADVLREAGADVRVVRLPGGPDGAKVGADDFLLARGAGALRKLLAAARPPDRPTAGDDETPVVVIGTDEYRVNDEAIIALGSARNVFQRAGALVFVTRAEADTDPAATLRRPVGSVVVRDLSPPLLRDRLTRCARFVKRGTRRTKGDDGKVVEEPVETPVHPPDWAVPAIHARGHWPGVRRLEAVVTHPVLTADGSILAANGYDRRTGLLLAVPTSIRVAVPDSPTGAQVRAAAAELLDVVREFPIAKKEHKAAWVASVLTPLAWFAFEGPAPLTLIDGNVRGVGKGLLADVAALILLGRRFPVMSYTPDREELRKKITTLAAEGERLVLLDNLAGAVGNDVFDSALTSSHWKDRLLGTNRQYDGPLHVVWYATGNNVAFQADTARRVSHVRLETTEEKPEERNTWVYPRLRHHVRENRGRLLSAALTILRGWVVAGRPGHGGKAWGSFEGWSDTVRAAVKFATGDDPGDTRAALQAAADTDAEAMAAFIACLEQLDPNREGMTAGAVIDVVTSADENRNPALQTETREAVVALCRRLDAHALGVRLRQFQRRNIGGRMIDKAGNPKGSVRWRVVPATAPDRAETSPPSPPSPPGTAPRPGGDGGDGGDVSGRGGNGDDDPRAAAERRAIDAGDD